MSELDPTKLFRISEPPRANKKKEKIPLFLAAVSYVRGFGFLANGAKIFLHLAVSSKVKVCRNIKLTESFFLLLKCSSF